MKTSSAKIRYSRSAWSCFFDELFATDNYYNVSDATVSILSWKSVQTSTFYYATFSDRKKPRKPLENRRNDDEDGGGDDGMNFNRPSAAVIAFRDESGR